MLKWLASVSAAVLCATVAASAAVNVPVVYPRDGSQRYAYGFSGIDYPVVRVQRGHLASIMLEPGENLPPTQSNGVLLDDRVRWSAVATRSGGGTLANGDAVPVTWIVSVEPANDAQDAWLSIATDRGRHYMLHLVPVARNSSDAQRLVSFYFYRPSAYRPRALRQGRVADLPAWATP